MKFGIMFLFSEFGNIPQAQVFHEFLEEVEYAEELGFDSVWLPEHHFSVYGMLGDVLTLAAAVAQRTKRIKIGTAVVLLPLNHPVRVAEQAALVDVLSQGRLLLGVGRAYQPAEFAGFGIPPDTSRAMFLEGLEILEKTFTQEKFSHEGRYWTVKDVTLFPKPVQQPRPPIYWAAVTPPSYELAGRMGYPILRSPRFTRIDLVEEHWQVYCQRIRERGGDPDQMDAPLLMQTYVAESDEEARREAEPHAMWYHQLLSKVLPGAPGVGVSAGYELYASVQQKHTQVTYDDLYEWGSAFGSPDRVIERIKLYAERCGTNHWMSEMKFGGMPHEKAMRSMELFAKHVMPAFKEQATKPS